MRKRDAQAMGRFCWAHQQVHRRVRMESGAFATGCPDCLAKGHRLAAALGRMVELAQHERSATDARGES